MASHVESLSRKRKANEEPGGPPEKVASPSVTSEAPRGINVAEFAQARAMEMHNMINEISYADKKGSKRIFQSLPKHMRRRAVSHNVKRMPVRLRQFEKKEESNQAEIHKKKPRRQRRKTKALLDDYNRRKKNNIWLETHIWHAKRMKMVNVWGYKLAEHPSDKSFRACHRAVANTCLLQDISYYSCIEVKGIKSDIISAMSQITRKELGPTIASVEYIKTGKEGHVMLYHPNRYPYGAIGPVAFMWRQFNVNDNNENQLSQLWIWIHPSCFDEGLRVIQNICTQDTIKYEPCSSTPSSVRCDEGNQNSRTDNITVSSLQYDLVRLRLTGPLAHPLLVEMLELACESKKSADQLENIEKTTALKDSSKITESNNNSNGSSHHKDRQECDSTLILNGKEVWKSLKSVSSSSVLQPNCTIALTVLDPRLGLPGKRTSIDAAVTEKNTEQNTESSSQILYSKWPPSVAASTLWDSDTRQFVKGTKLDDHELNCLRSNLLLPGTRVDLDDKASRIPILLVQQPGIRGYGAGWDIILPAGWTMPFWMSLVYRGARVGGLRESRNCSLESEVPHFPRDVPDTEAGKRCNDEVQKEGESKFSKYPPNKRPNYHKFGIPSPFYNPWNRLVKEWILEEERQTLKSSISAPLDGNLSTGSNTLESLPNNSKSLGNGTKSPQNDTESSPNDTESYPNENESLPNSGDCCETSCREGFYVLRDSSKLKNLRDSFKVPKTENIHLVEGSINLNSAPNITKNSLNALVAVSLRMINQGFPLPNATVSIPSSSDLKELQKIKKFGGPTEPLHKGLRRDVSHASNRDTLIGCCTRNVIGFVTSGQYSLSRGHGVGIAYCALPGLVRLLSVGRDGTVLVRNTSSQQYRFAFLSVL